MPVTECLVVVIEIYTHFVISKPPTLHNKTKLLYVFQVYEYLILHFFLVVVILTNV